VIIKFNVPIKSKYSKVNVKKLMDSEEGILGPGKNYRKIQKFLKKNLVLKTSYLLIAAHPA